MLKNLRVSKTGNGLTQSEALSQRSSYEHAGAETPASARQPFALSANEPPLCVDLDGTLVAVNTLTLALRQLLARQPWVIFHLSIQVFRGRAAFKHSVAKRIQLDPARLPYRSSLVEFLRAQKCAGRHLILATAAPEAIAHAVATHLGLFAEVIASGERHNTKGQGKVAAIRSHLNGGEFDYIGDSFADLPVFRAARRALLVQPSDRLLAIVNRDCHVQTVFRA